jgi:hypothetical protein
MIKTREYATLGSLWGAIVDLNKTAIASLVTCGMSE